MFPRGTLPRMRRRPKTSAAILEVVIGTIWLIGSNANNAFQRRQFDPVAGFCWGNVDSVLQCTERVECDCACSMNVRTI